MHKISPGQVQQLKAVLAELVTDQLNVQQMTGPHMSPVVLVMHSVYTQILFLNFASTVSGLQSTTQN